MVRGWSVGKGGELSEGIGECLGHLRGVDMWRLGKQWGQFLRKATGQSLARAGCSIRMVVFPALVALPRDTSVGSCFGCDVGSFWRES